MNPSTALADPPETTAGAAPSETPHVRVAIIGTGFAGLGMAIRLRQTGVTDFVVLERAQDVGGTWRDNTYPGCQCDVPSHLYSFSFAPNPEWSRTYSGQPEIWEYLRRQVREHDLEPHLRLGHEVTDAHWDDEAQRWHIETSRGPLTARVLVAGTGPLTEPVIPELPGLDSFQGRMFHSARWEHDHDLDGERVAVVGTGASAIQFVPKIQSRVGKMHVFQRTAPWVLPHTDRPVSRLERTLYRAVPFAQKAVRILTYWSREALVPGLVHEQRLMAVPELLGRRHLKRQVPDRDLRRKLRPHFRIGCKRILLSNHWYPALGKPNVEVVTEGVKEVRARSIVAADGTEREVDTIIWGTGFHVTDPPAAKRLRGRDGRTLDEVCQGSPRAYYGTAIAGFPNLFMLIGPNTGLGHNSMVFMIESQLSYVLDCLRMMDEREIGTVEVREEVQASYNADLQRRFKGSVWMSGCSSWYLDDNGNNTTVWPSFTWDFRRRTRRFDPASYRLGAARPAAAPVA